MSNFAFLADDENVVSPIGEIFSTPDNVHSSLRDHEGTETICGKMDIPTLLDVPLEDRRRHPKIRLVRRVPRKQRRVVLVALDQVEDRVGD